MSNLDFYAYDIKQLERFIERCRNEIKTREQKSSKPFSETDLELALSAQIAAFRRNRDRARVQFQMPSSTRA